MKKHAAIHQLGAPRSRKPREHGKKARPVTRNGEMVLQGTIAILTLDSFLLFQKNVSFQKAKPIWAHPRGTWLRTDQDAERKRRSKHLSMFLTRPQRRRRGGVG